MDSATQVAAKIGWIHILISVRIVLQAPAIKNCWGFPSISEQHIKKVLDEMKKGGELRLIGRGRGARWEASSHQ